MRTCGRPCNHGIFIRFVAAGENNFFGRLHPFGYLTGAINYIPPFGVGCDIIFY
jgi:hypothetical protein